MMSQNEKYLRENKELYYGVGSFILEIVKVFILALVIVTPIRVFLFQPFFVQGGSMSPNFKDGEYLIINEFGFKRTDIGFGEADFFSVKPFKKFERGDVAVFRYPKEPKQFFIKRVIGLPGETISINNGEVRIFNSDYPDGIVLNEEYLIPLSVSTSPDMEISIGDDEYFMAGDNRGHSHDSRSFGPINKDSFVGKVLLRAWPLDRIFIF